MAWTFTQEGPAPKVLTLTGWAQPFGRPRNGAVVDIGREVLRTVTRLPGNVDPIVNAFTGKSNDWQMHGRWMDRVMGAGPGAAMRMAQQWKQFVEDKRIVLASWDNLIAYRIFIHKFSAGVEGNNTSSASGADKLGFVKIPGTYNEIAWQLEADVITDLSMSAPSLIPPVQTPSVQAAAMAGLIPAAVKPWTDPLGPLAWALALFPTLAQALSVIEHELMVPFNLVYQIASQISDFESALQADLMGMASGVGQVQTAVYNLRQTTDQFSVAVASMQAQYADQPAFGLQPIFSAGDVINFQASKVQSDRASAALLAVMAYLQSQVRFYLRGATRTAYTAVAGDTWETIALATLGAIDAAQAIRDANGVTFGQQPVGGKNYQIPAGG
jgi:hypothetical protein